MSGGARATSGAESAAAFCVSFLFNDWITIVRILVVGPLAYIGVLVVLRVSGKRTLSKMNAFDLVVTIALGSALSTTILSRDTAVLDGLVAIALLVALQYVVALVSSRWPRAERMVKSEPRVVVRKGVIIEEAAREERVSQREIEQAVRNGGAANVGEVEYVILETDGTFSVISSSAGGSTSALPKHDSG